MPTPLETLNAKIAAAEQQAILDQGAALLEAQTTAALMLQSESAYVDRLKAIQQTKADAIAAATAEFEASQPPAPTEPVAPPTNLRATGDLAKPTWVWDYAEPASFFLYLWLDGSAPVRYPAPNTILVAYGPPVGKSLSAWVTAVVNGVESAPSAKVLIKR